MFAKFIKLKLHTLRAAVTLAIAIVVISISASQIVKISKGIQEKQTAINLAISELDNAKEIKTSFEKIGEDNIKKLEAKLLAAGDDIVPVRFRESWED